MQKPQITGFSRLQRQIYEAMMEALSTIRNNKLRSGLVILGVTIGVASLMGIVSTVAGFNHFMAESISNGDKPLLQLNKIDITKGEGPEEFRKRKNFEIEDAAAIAELPHVDGVYIEYARQTSVKYRDRKAHLIPVVGSNQEMLKIQSINIGRGRYFTREEEHRSYRLAVLGDQTNKSLFPDEDAIGKSIRIQGREYEVIGVLEPRKTFFGSLAENFVVVPYGAYSRDFLMKDDPLELIVIVSHVQYQDEVESNVRALMRMRRGVPIGQPDDFAIIPLDAMVDFFQSITNQVALVLVVLAAIALMIGGIGVMVIMLVSVTERTHEIGIRKAIGATRAQITWQFLIEAATLSAFGGVLGLLGGMMLAFVIAKFAGFPFIVPIGWTLIALIVSAGVGLVFGIFPAHKAAKLDPIVALRYE